jgi:Mrp family chromosome partitioning ATPase
VASFLAFAGAAAGKKTLLIECDLRRPVLASRLGINASPGLTDLVSGSAEQEDVIQSVSFSDLAGSDNHLGPKDEEPADAPHPHQLDCVTAGSSTRDPVDVVTSDRFKSFLAEMRSSYDFVVLDTTPLLVVVDALELLPEAAAIVVCVRAGRTTRDQARAGKEAIARLPDRPAGLVVTGARPQDEAEYGYYGYYQ